MSFLSSMLPTIIGAGAVAATGGAAAPWVAAGLGALEAKRTGSLQKGLMAGLGAYGGGSLAAGLTEAGAANIGEQALTSEAGRAQAAEQMLGGAAQEEARSQVMKDAIAKASPFDKFSSGLSGLTQPGGVDYLKMGMTEAGGPSLGRAGLAATAPALLAASQPPTAPTGDSTMPQRLKYEQGTATPFPQPDVPDYANLGQDFGRQQRYFPGAGYTQITPEEAKSIRGYAAGGYMGGGPVEQMSNEAAVGMNTGFPQADITGHAYATPWQTPMSQNVVTGTADTGVNRMTGEMLASGGIADAQYNLGGYSDGGRLLRGPGDGVSDSIPAVIGHKKPARLADGEFVVPARIVSELGNGSTDAGARKLYAMLDRVQSARKKSIGKGKVAKDSRADKLLPA